MRIKTSLYVITFFLFSSFSVGQSPSKINDKFADIKQPTKIDEFGDISEKEFAPKLRSYIETLKNNKSSSGYVIFYNDFNFTPFKKTKHFARAKLNLIAEYLDRPYVDYPRITYLAGGLKDKMTTELWIVPAGGEVPKPTNFLDYAKNERYKLDKLDTRRIPIKEAYYRTEKIEEDVESEDSNSSLEKEMLSYFYENPEDFFEDFTKELAEVLSQDKTWRANLFFYADRDEFDIQTLRQIIENQLKTNFEKLNVNVSQVKIIFGGYRSTPQIDTWIIPKNGVEPEAMPDEKILVELN